jgi:hypothetical protein
MTGRMTGISPSSWVMVAGDIDFRASVLRMLALGCWHSEGYWHWRASVEWQRRGRWQGWWHRQKRLWPKGLGWLVPLCQYEREKKRERDDNKKRVYVLLLFSPSRYCLCFSQSLSLFWALAGTGHSSCPSAYRPASPRSRSHALLDPERRLAHALLDPASALLEHMRQPVTWLMTLDYATT